MSRPVCPCDEFAHPRQPWNPPGLTEIAYRTGDFRSFRRALLAARPGERQLTRWRPGARQDLALQLIEWWAYLADVLTFYDERIARQAYLRTADLPESVHRLVRLLGYRPRPGIGATGTVAALLTGPAAVTVPAGFPVQSKPAPGKEPQLYEVGAATPVVPPDAVQAVPAPDGLLVKPLGALDSVLLAGSVTTVQPGDDVLLLPRSGGGTRVRARVASVLPERAPVGARYTRVAFTSPLGLGTALASDYRLVRHRQSARPWPYPAAPGIVVKSTALHLDSVARQIAVGQPVVVEVPGSASPAPAVVTVTSYDEVIWYANGSWSDPGLSAALPAGVPHIPILHSRLGFSALPGAGTFDTQRAAVAVRFDWQDVGRPVPTPVAAVPPEATTLSLAVDGPTGHSAPMASRPVLVEGSDRTGIPARASGGPGSLDLSGLPTRTEPLRSPVRVLFGLLPVSRGVTVRGEVLGSGDATAAGQEFTLKKKPLTYLPDPDAADGYASTLTVFVDGIRWGEAPSFYAQPAWARVFVTREDPDGATRVQFGDGVYGSRLPSGAGNVIADYRYGSGADAPAAGSLTVVVTPLPGLRGIRNPVAVGGGGDPDPPDQLRRYAPRSVLTFGRAVSADDYEAIAATAPGVARARSYWAFDALEQRAVVMVYAGDDAAAVTSARTALAGAGDPNRPVTVHPATAVPVTLALTVVVDASRAPGPVLAAVEMALGDPDTGLLGRGAVRIGEPLWSSAVDAACVDVPGVLAVHGLQFTADHGSGPQPQPGPRFDPGEGAFFRLDALDVHAEGGKS